MGQPYVSNGTLRYELVSITKNFADPLQNSVATCPSNPYTQYGVPSVPSSCTHTVTHETATLLTFKFTNISGRPACYSADIKCIDGGVNVDFGNVLSRSSVGTFSTTDTGFSDGGGFSCLNQGGQLQTAPGPYRNGCTTYSTTISGWNTSQTQPLVLNPNQSIQAQIEVDSSTVAVGNLASYIPDNTPTGGAFSDGYDYEFTFNSDGAFAFDSYAPLSLHKGVYWIVN